MSAITGLRGDDAGVGEGLPQHTQPEEVVRMAMRHHDELELLAGTAHHLHHLGGLAQGELRIHQDGVALALDQVRVDGEA